MIFTNSPTAQKIKRRIHNASGFTLIETMIAIAIMASGLILLVTSWNGSFMRVRKTQLSTEVSALLERKIVEIESEFQGKPLDSIPEEKSDDFGSEYPQYSWKMASRKIELPDLMSLFAPKQEGGPPPDPALEMIVRTFTDYLNKSIKEVKVTVIYKGGKKPLEFSASEYFIDYDKDITPGGSPGGSN